MQTNSDLQGEMTRFPFDDTTVDRLLGGTMAPDDAPPELRHVAELAVVARGPASEAEMWGKEHAVASFTSSIRSGSGVANPERKRSMLGKFATVRVLAIAAPVALLGAGAAAAATNSLPAPAQHAASVALSHVDISVPDPHHSQNGSTTSPNSGATGPTVTPTSPAAFGLCTAFTAGGLDSHSIAYRNLAAAATGAGQSIAAFCAPIIAAHSAHSSGGTNGASTNNDQTSGGGSSGGGTGHGNKGKSGAVSPPHP